MYGGERFEWGRHFEQETGEWFAACTAGRRERRTVLGAGRVFWTGWLRRRPQNGVRERRTPPLNREREAAPLDDPGACLRDEEGLR